MDNKYKGMTVNERLYMSGLIKEFDEAVRKKDQDKLMQILNKVELSDSSIEDVIKELLQ